MNPETAGDSSVGMEDVLHVSQYRAERSGWNTAPERFQDVACDATGLLLFFSRTGNS